MDPFKPGHEWYETYWYPPMQHQEDRYTPKPMTRRWRVTSAVIGAAVVVFLVLLR